METTNREVIEKQKSDCHRKESMLLLFNADEEGASSQVEFGAEKYFGPI